MKNLLIASLLLISFSFSAQVEKNPKKEKGTSTQITTKNPKSTSKAASSSAKPSNFNTDKKPVGFNSDKKPNTSKPTPIKPVKGDVNRPAKPSNMTPANSTGNEKPEVKGSASSPSKSVSNSRAAASSSAKPSVTSEKSTKSKTPAKGNLNNQVSSAKPSGNSSEFCKGWEDGYIKGWNLNKKTPEKPNVPPCAITKTCDDYKCGYKMGMKKAESSKR